MDQLTKALEYLNKRGIDTKKGNGALISQMNKIISVNEVDNILSMVQNGTFEKFVNHLGKILPQSEKDTYSPDFWV